MSNNLRQPTKEGVQTLMKEIMGKPHGADLYFDLKRLFDGKEGATVKDISLFCTKIQKFMGPVYNMKKIVEGFGITMQEWKANRGI